MRPSPSGPPRSGRPGSLLGCVLLAGALGAAGMLAFQHLGRAALPGCALDSPCQRALGGPFGSVPLLGWPVAFVGAAYFGGLLAAWGAARGGAWPHSLAWVVRAGGLASLAFLLLAFAQGTPCPYCIATQLASLAFVPCSERARGPGRAPRLELTFLLVALGLSGLLGALRAADERGAERRAERELAESTAAIGATLEEGAPAGFRGRYRRGPERAPLRLVLFTDYQCEDCARIEGEAWQLCAERADLTLSIKHFPLCSDCNVRARALGQNPHPNACWAARAAEAAGIVGGEEGFWRMHRWLFARGGAFTEGDLKPGLVELGLEPGAFVEALHGGETLARVTADVEEGLALGVQSTPMVFLNGVELRGWRASGALRRALETLAARSPPAEGAEADRPQDALAKGLEDWRLEPRVALPARAGEAPPRSSLEVVLWSDYLDASTRELDRRIRAYRAEHPSVHYSFRHYPLDPECVGGAPARNPGACRLAAAAAAARLLGGAEAGARFHEWAFSARAPLDEAKLVEGARLVGLDAQALLALAAGEGARLVRADVDDARRLGIHAIPLLYVGGRRVPRWKLEGEELLERILDEARAGR